MNLNASAIALPMPPTKPFNASPKALNPLAIPPNPPPPTGAAGTAAAAVVPPPSNLPSPGILENTLPSPAPKPPPPNIPLNPLTAVTSVAAVVAYEILVCAHSGKLSPNTLAIIPNDVAMAPILATCSARCWFAVLCIS